MAVGPNDKLDKMLVRKYQNIKVDNPVVESSLIDPHKMMNAMNDYANAHLAAYTIQQTLRDVCIKAMSNNIQYIKMEKPKTRIERMQEAARKIVAAQMAKKNALAQKLARDPRPEFA